MPKVLSSHLAGASKQSSKPSWLCLAAVSPDKEAACSLDSLLHGGFSRGQVSELTGAVATGEAHIQLECNILWTQINDCMMMQARLKCAWRLQQLQLLAARIRYILTPMGALSPDAWPACSPALDWEARSGSAILTAHCAHTCKPNSA